MKCIFVAAVAVLALSLVAQAEIVNRTKFVSFQSFVPCANNNAGEIVDISGYFVTRLYLHVVGTTFSGYFQFRPQNMTGTGESTGTIYHAVGDTMGNPQRTHSPDRRCHLQLRAKLSASQRYKQFSGTHQSAVHHFRIRELSDRLSR